MSVKINKIVEPICKLYEPNGLLVGEITSFIQLNDIRVQIKQKQISGYYIVWEDYSMYIDKDGRLDEWPKGFYDHTDIQLEELLK